MKKILISLISLLHFLYALPQDGTLDLSFGNNGITIIPNVESFRQPKYALQKDGKIIMAGGAEGINYESFSIFRFNSDGSPDVNFDNDGKLVINLEYLGYGNNIGINVTDIDILQDGSLLISGYGYNANFNGNTNFLLRLNSDGSKFTAFGQNGYVQIGNSGDPYGAGDVQTFPVKSNKLVIAASVIIASGYQSGKILITRMLNDGTLDPEFEINEFGGSWWLPSTLSVAGDGSIYFRGVDVQNNEYYWTIHKLNEDGGASDFISLNIPPSPYLLFNAPILELSENKLMLTGTIYNNSTSSFDIILLRFSKNGDWDTDFGNGGIKIIPMESSSSFYIYGNSLQKDNRIILSGFRNNYTEQAEAIIIKLKPDGSFDMDFNETGIFRLPSLPVVEGLAAIFNMNLGLQEDGKILFGGFFNNYEFTQFGWYVARLNNTDNPQSCVNSGLAANITDAYAVNPGGNINTVYIGYQPASSITLTASPSGGNAPYSYNWSTSPSQTTQQITVSPTTTSAYTCTVTDATGCATSSTKTITVVDIRTPGKPGKVNICHRDLKGKWTTLSVLASSVAEHLAHGDYLGICNNNSSNSEILTRAANETGGQEIIQKGFKLYPNPATHFIDVQWTTKNTSQTSIRILNAEGKTVKTITTQGGVNQQRITLNGLAKGVYMLVLKTGADQQVSKFVIQ